ncbi:MAG: hypothetical protein IK017_11465 [Paludibacteraceae bacterium]|nr:hypothetical protein [Paludibacteraceae bacterium]MBR5973256.1 hypothetical protein [Paludibacteraceae bacterium]
MLEELKRKYVDWQIKLSESDKKFRREKQFLNWDDVKTVTVLLAYEGRPNNAEMDQIMQTLSDKVVSIWCFVSSKEYLRQDSEKVTYLNPKSLTLFSIPNKIIKGRYIADKSDVMIDLTLKENFPLKYLAGISKSRCRCGKKKENYSLYDLEISPTETLSRVDLLEQILYYLKTIKTKN